MAQKVKTCKNCFWYNPEMVFDGKHCCVTFMNGIPDDILNGAEHTEVREGQIDDTVFTPIPEPPSVMVL